MADNKKWFKVWTSLLTDPEFDDIPNQAIGAWVRLGALIAQHGENGLITVSKQQLLKRTNLTESELNNITPSLSQINVEIKNSDNGTCFVSFKQWAKYQTDWNSYERLKKFRKSQMITKHETVQDKTKTKTKTKEEEKNNNIYNQVILFLNEKANTFYKPTTKTTQNLIKVRMNEGFTLENFKKVIEKKVLDWGKDPKMIKFLRPETLFGTKFESYLNEPEADDWKDYHAGT